MESIDTLRGEVRENTNWKVELPDGTGYHRMTCIAECMLELLDDVEREVEEGYVPRAVDYDGDYVHVGDKMTGWDHCDEDHVSSVHLLSYEGDWVAFGHDEDGEEISTYASSLFRYDEPTVAGILRKFADKCIDAKWPTRLNVTDDEIEEYANEITALFDVEDDD